MKDKKLTAKKEENWCPLHRCHLNDTQKDCLYEGFEGCPMVPVLRQCQWKNTTNKTNKTNTTNKTNKTTKTNKTNTTTGTCIPLPEKRKRAAALEYGFGPRAEPRVKIEYCKLFEDPEYCELFEDPDAAAEVCGGIYQKESCEEQLDPRGRKMWCSSQHANRKCTPIPPSRRKMPKEIIDDMADRSKISRHYHRCPLISTVYRNVRHRTRLASLPGQCPLFFKKPTAREAAEDVLCRQLGQCKLLSTGQCNHQLDSEGRKMCSMKKDNKWLQEKCCLIDDKKWKPSTTEVCRSIPLNERNEVVLALSSPDTPGLLELLQKKPFRKGSMVGAIVTVDDLRYRIPPGETPEEILHALLEKVAKQETAGTAENMSVHEWIEDISHGCPLMRRTDKVMIDGSPCTIPSGGTPLEALQQCLESRAAKAAANHKLLLAAANYKKLLLAASEGKEQVVQMLIDAGVNLNRAYDEYEYGLTPLHLAASEGKEQVVKLLIAAKAHLNSADDGGNTPLHLAAWKGHEAVVKMLIKAGADLNTADDDGETPLFQAAGEGQVKVVQMLINAGADLNKEDDEGKTPLFQAASEEKEQVVEMLIKARAEWNLQKCQLFMPNSVSFRGVLYVR